MTRREFQNTGRYAHDMDAVCVCGHVYGEHLAIVSKHQACMGYIAPSPTNIDSEPCSCQCFKKDRKKAMS